MIISKTPFRISFVGGGSDIPAFYKQEMGAVISSSINKYMYIALNSKFDGAIRLSYSKTESVSNALSVEHPLIRNSMLITGVTSGVEISSLADIPSEGSGLGSSSSYVVGLLNALYAFKGQIQSKERLAQEACKIEIELCAGSLGKQDQYAAAYGGFNLMEFHPTGRVAVTPVVCSQERMDAIENSMLIFYTGKTRSALSILKSQILEMDNSVKRGLVRAMAKLTYDFKFAVENFSGIEELGEILDQNWRLKKQIVSGISDESIDDWYRIAKENGAIGGKLLGAGNGGFLLFLAKPDKHLNIINSLSSLRKVSFKFDYDGSKIVFFQENK
jgi:D-glycero-alpha-D-manno-heptose-7-phosphate kinase